MARSFTFDSLGSQNPVAQVAFLITTNPLKAYLRNMETWKSAKINRIFWNALTKSTFKIEVIYRKVDPNK